MTANPAPWRSAWRSAPARSSGRDKLTLVVPPALEAFGLWVEQLVAESTGKSGDGVVPIAGEAAGPAERLRRGPAVRPRAARGADADASDDRDCADV